MKKGPIGAALQEFVQSVYGAQEWTSACITTHVLNSRCSPQCDRLSDRPGAGHKSAMLLCRLWTQMLEVIQLPVPCSVRDMEESAL